VPREGLGPPLSSILVLRERFELSRPRFEGGDSTDWSTRAKHWGVVPGSNRLRENHNLACFHYTNDTTKMAERGSSRSPAPERPAAFQAVPAARAGSSSRRMGRATKDSSRPSLPPRGSALVGRRRGVLRSAIRFSKTFYFEWTVRESNSRLPGASRACYHCHQQPRNSTVSPVCHPALLGCQAWIGRLSLVGGELDESNAHPFGCPGVRTRLPTFQR
jgi:hypothetical protein